MQTGLLLAFVALISTEAQASSCLSDVCLDAQISGPFRFDGIQLIADLNFGGMGEFGKKIGLKEKSIFPKVGIGAVFSVDTKDGTRIPLFTPYGAITPFTWSDSRGRSISGFGGVAGVQLLGTAEVGVGGVRHGRRIPALAGHGIESGGSPATASYGTQAFCTRLVNSWKGWKPNKEALATSIWKDAFEHADSGVDLSTTPPDPFVWDGDSGVQALLRTSCAEKGLASEIIRFIEDTQVAANDESGKYWESKERADGFYYLSVVPASLLRNLSSTFGVDEQQPETP